MPPGRWWRNWRGGLRTESLQPQSSVPSPQSSHFLPRQLSRSPDGQIADANRTDRDAHELEHFRAQGLDHAPNLTVAAFGDRDFEDALAAALANAFDARRARRSIFELDSAAELVELRISQVFGCLHEVRLRHFVIGIRQPLGERRVVRENQQPAGVEIEPADGEEILISLQQIVNRRSPLWIAIGRQVSLRFVK